MWRNSKIVETISGSVSSTKQFVWSEDRRREERDDSSNLTSRFFIWGQSTGGASYYYCKPHLGSIGEMTDASGVVHAQYSFDPYGRATKIKGSLDADFQYAGYYLHQPSKLSLTLLRAYASSMGRWINRDPIEEWDGSNLFRYVANHPITSVDPLGLFLRIICFPTDCTSEYCKCIDDCKTRRRNGEYDGLPIMYGLCVNRCKLKFPQPPPPQPPTQDPNPSGTTPYQEEQRVRENDKPWEHFRDKNHIPSPDNSFWNWHPEVPAPNNPHFNNVG